MKRSTLNFEPAFPRDENAILEIFANTTDKTVVKNSFLQAILNNLPINILVFNNKSTLIYVNSHFCNLIGYSKDELFNLTLNEFARLLIAENTYDFTRYPKILAGEVIRNYSYTFRHKDGQHIVVNYSSYPLRIESNSQPIGCLCIIEPQGKVEVKKCE